MAKINNGDGFKHLDLEAIRIEKEIIEKEKKERAKVPRKRKPRLNNCILCGNKVKEKAVNVDFEGCRTLEDALCLIDDADERLTKYCCSSCNSFWGTTLNPEYGGLPDPYPGWDPQSAIQRLEKIKETGYCTILKSQKFAAPSGNTIEVEFGDVFPVSRVQSTEENKRAIDFYSLDIMIGADVLKLFPWEVGSISWAEIMLELREGNYETVYLGDSDIVGYFEPKPEVREMIKSYFGDR